VLSQFLKKYLCDSEPQWHAKVGHSQLASVLRPLACFPLSCEYSVYVIHPVASAAPLFVVRVRIVRVALVADPVAALRARS
jgi:hypothetical protein